LQIEVASIDTDLNFRDRDLKSEHWFDAETYPSIQFSSTKVEELDNGLLVTGDLTIKETTKQVTLTLAKPSGVLKDGRSDLQVIFTGTVTIDRKSFGVMGDRWSKVKEGITAVSSDVEIEFTALGKRIQKANYSNWVKDKTSPQGNVYSVYKKDGLDEAFTKYDELALDPANKISMSTLNTVAYMMLKEGEINDAVKAFKKNKDLYADDANVYESYAEALAANQQWAESKENYQKALAMNKNNMNAKEILKHL
jgi:YceI-like protein